MVVVSTLLLGRPAGAGYAALQSRPSRSLAQQRSAARAATGAPKPGSKRNAPLPTPKKMPAAPTGPAVDTAPGAKDLENSILEIFNGHNVERVVQSVRRLRLNEPEFEKLHSPGGLQQAHSYVEGAHN